MLQGFPRRCCVALPGDFWASGQRRANMCLSGRHLRCCSGFLGLIEQRKRKLVSVVLVGG